MTSPATRYSDTHLWFSREHAGDEVRVGITERIAGALTLVEQVFLPPPSSRVTAGHELVCIDAQKAAFEIATPVDLDVLTVNEDLAADPLLVRLEPRSRGWLLTARLAPEHWAGLLDHAAYTQLVEREINAKANENCAGPPGWQQKG
jgi:glycine cleavage system H protein